MKYLVPLNSRVKVALMKNILLLSLVKNNSSKSVRLVSLEVIYLIFLKAFLDKVLETFDTSICGSANVKS
jgi:hypothetical protein